MKDSNGSITHAPAARAAQAWTRRACPRPLLLLPSAEPQRAGAERLQRRGLLTRRVSAAFACLLLGCRLGNVGGGNGVSEVTDESLCTDRIACQTAALQPASQPHTARRSGERAVRQTDDTSSVASTRHGS